MLNVTFLWYIFWHAIAQKKAGIFSDINFETLSGIFWHSIRHLFDTYSDIAVDMLPNMLSDTLSCFVDEYFDILSHLPSDVHSDILSFIWHFVQDSLRPTCWQFCGILSDIRSNIYCSLRTSSLAFCPTFSLTYIVAFLSDIFVWHVFWHSICHVLFGSGDLQRSRENAQRSRAGGRGRRPDMDTLFFHQWIAGVQSRGNCNRFHVSSTWFGSKGNPRSSSWRLSRYCVNTLGYWHSCIYVNM